MPHAAICWCNPVQIRAKSPVPKFQCRTRQFTGAMEKITMINDRELFQCRTRQICWCNFLLPSHAALYGVSMPHAAIYWCNEQMLRYRAAAWLFQCRTRQFSGAIRHPLWFTFSILGFNAARGNLLVQWHNLRRKISCWRCFNAARGNLLVQ